MRWEQLFEASVEHSRQTFATQRDHQESCHPPALAGIRLGLDWTQGVLEVCLSHALKSKFEARSQLCCPRLNTGLQHTAAKLRSASCQS